MKRITSIINHFRTHPATSAIFLRSGVLHLYPIKLPDTGVSFPACLYQLIDGVDRNNLEGKNTNNRSRYQFTVVTKTYNEKEDAIAAIKQAFVGFVGIMGGIDGNKLSSIEVLDRDDYDEVTKLYRGVIDLEFLHTYSL